jgi:hypothetical protein
MKLQQLQFQVNSLLKTPYHLNTYVRSVGRNISGKVLYEITCDLNVAKNLSFVAICVHIRHIKKEISSDT